MRKKKGTEIGLPLEQPLRETLEEALYRRREMIVQQVANLGQKLVPHQEGSLTLTEQLGELTSILAQRNEPYLAQLAKSLRTILQNQVMILACLDLLMAEALRGNEQALEKR